MKYKERCGKKKKKVRHFKRRYFQEKSAAESNAERLSKMRMESLHGLW